MRSSGDQERNCTTALKSLAEGGHDPSRTTTGSDVHRTDLNKCYDETDQCNRPNNQISNSDRNSNFDMAAINLTSAKTIARQNLSKLITVVLKSVSNCLIQKFCLVMHF